MQLYIIEIVCIKVYIQIERKRVYFIIQPDHTGLVRERNVDGDIHIDTSDGITCEQCRYNNVFNCLSSKVTCVRVVEVCVSGGSKTFQ